MAGELPAKIGELKVRTIGTGKNRIKIVLLPGSRHEPEHFFPENLRVVKQLGDRAELIQNRVTGARFIAKQRRKPPSKKEAREDPVDWHGKAYMEALALKILSEVRLARYVNGLNLRGIRAEEPVAIILRGPKGDHSAIYRQIAPRLRSADEGKLRKAVATLERHGIVPFLDVHLNVHQRGKTLHFFDLEHWAAAETVRRKIQIPDRDWKKVFKTHAALIRESAKQSYKNIQR